MAKFKVLIIGPNYFGYTDSIADAFRLKGWKAFVENYDDPVHPFSGMMKLRHKFAKDKERVRAHSRARYKIYIEKVFSQLHPDLVFVLNGNILEKESMEFFRSTSKVFVWMFDNVKRFPRCVENIDSVDAFACFDKSDVDMLSQLNHNVYFLPQACDCNRYFPIETVKKDIDILFVGNMVGYAKRKELLNRVVDRFGDKYNVKFYGIYELFTKNPIKWMCRPHKSVFKNCSVAPADVNVLYNRARVVINIHHEEQKQGANPKVYEISGTKSYQVCDKNKYISSLFPNGEVGLYENEEELFEHIDYALNHNMSANINAAYNTIITKHTFSCRIDDVLEWMGFC